MKMREWFGSNPINPTDLASNFISRGQLKAAAHAINHHDRLVAMLEKILAVYEMDYDDTTAALNLIDECKKED